MFTLSKFLPLLPQGRIANETDLYANNASPRLSYVRQYLLCLRATKVRLSSGRLVQLKNNGLLRYRGSVGGQYGDLQVMSSQVNDTSSSRHRSRQQKDVQRTTWSTQLWLPLQRYTKPCIYVLNATSLAKLNAFQQLVTDTDSVDVVIIFQLIKSLSQNVYVIPGS